MYQEGCVSERFFHELIFLIKFQVSLNGSIVHAWV